MLLKTEEMLIEDSGGDSSYGSFEHIEEEGSLAVGQEEIMRQFIKLYKGSPELWDSSNPNYMHKNKRNAAVDKLVAVYAKIKPMAAREDVRKKINTLRTNYRKELKKIALSVSQGSDYQPSSWLFYALDFLPKNDISIKVDFAQMDESLQDDDGVNKTDEARNFNNVITSPSITLSAASSSTSLQPSQKKMKFTPKFVTSSKAPPHECPTCQNTPDDNLSSILKVWREKLSSLKPQQKLFAEKAINDVLFEASLETLTRHSVKINHEN